MTNHDQGPGHQDLTALLRGELSNADVLRVRDHVAECPSCREELLELTVGHSLLSSATRSLRVPEAISVPEAPAAAAPTPPRRRRKAALGVAAALVLVGGAGLAGVLLDRDQPDQEGPASPPVPPSPPVAETRLEGVGVATGHGQVTMTGTDVTEMTVETTDLPTPRPDDYYYVWLLDPETNKMLPIGQIEAEGSTTFHLPLSLLRRYSAIDVSLEADNGDPSHSVTSVLRADYRPPSADETRS